MARDRKRNHRDAFPPLGSIIKPQLLIFDARYVWTGGCYNNCKVVWIEGKRNVLTGFRVGVRNVSELPISISKILADLHDHRFLPAFMPNTTTNTVYHSFDQLLYFFIRRLVVA